MKKWYALAAMVSPLLLAGCDAFNVTNQADDYFRSISTVKSLSMVIDLTTVDHVLTPTAAGSFVVNNFMRTWGVSSPLVKAAYLPGSNDNSFGIDVNVQNHPRISFTCVTQMKPKEADVVCTQR